MGVVHHTNGLVTTVLFIILQVTYLYCMNTDLFDLQASNQIAYHAEKSYICYTHYDRSIKLAGNSSFKGIYIHRWHLKLTHFSLIITKLSCCFSTITTMQGNSYITIIYNE